jgi:glycosyltransferase involved in cell wall biosynthesis
VGAPVSHELIFTATYNESANIGPWINAVVETRPSADILIIDDDSPDGTGTVVVELIKRHPQITLHTRTGKLGLSSAHIHAMRYALENEYDVLVTMDADGSRQPAQIPAVMSGPCRFLYRDPHPRRVPPSRITSANSKSRCKRHRTSFAAHGDQ